MSAGPRAFFALLSAAIAMVSGAYLAVWDSGGEEEVWFERASRSLGGFMFAAGIYFLIRGWPSREQTRREDRE